MVKDIHEFIDAIADGRGAWAGRYKTQLPWFRGEPSGAADFIPLLPKLFRGEQDENALLQFFRMRAPLLGIPIPPDRQETDKWLFLARHVGLPTRLLDWTEGALIALYFSLEAERRRRSAMLRLGATVADTHPPRVWMLNPQALNEATAGKTLGANWPTITWVLDRKRPDGTTERNVAAANIVAAWEGKNEHVIVEFPVAVHPTNIYPRVAAQHSCFTVHGSKEEGLAQLDDAHAIGCLTAFDIGIDPDEGLQQLRILGISHSTLFPDLEGLAKELEQLYGPSGWALP